MQTTVSPSQTALRVILFLIVVGVASGASINGQGENKEVLASVPVSLRQRLVERLNLLIEYQKAQQWDKQYDLLAAPVIQDDTKESHVKRLEQWYAQGLGDILVGFVPRSVAVHSDSMDHGEWTLFGCAKLRKGKRIVNLSASVSAYREEGDWYFSPIQVINPIDGKPERCPYHKSSNSTQTAKK